MNYETTVGVTKAHDANIGGGHGRSVTGHPTQGRTQGQSMPVYQYSEEEESDPEDIEDETGLERPIINGVRALTDSGAYRNPNRSGRADRSDGTGRNQTHEGIAEDSTTPAVKGISPRITYRQKASYSTVPKNTKGPAHGTQTAAKYIRDMPGRQPGTQYGTSRAPLPRHDQYDDNVFSLFDLKDPMERSYLEDQKRINRIKNMINYMEEE